MPPFLANSVLFLLVIIILASIFRDYYTINNILAARLLLKRRFRIIE
jgi:hypothetical protein